jgi:MFS-type transporter involved in bile tolerance (Atg22 family)
MTEREQIAATALALVAVVPLGILSWKLLVSPQDLPDGAPLWLVMGALLAFACLGPLTALSRRFSSGLLRAAQAATFFSLLSVGVAGVFGTTISLVFGLIRGFDAEPEAVGILVIGVILIVLAAALLTSLTIWTDQQKLRGRLLRLPKWIGSFAILAAVALVVLLR